MGTREIRLTIAIPTYNRREAVARTLAVLIPQVVAHPEVELILLDNDSRDADGASVVYEIPQHERVRVVRNRVNIGWANFLRGFEIAESEWLWICSDDDEVQVDAVEKILRRLDTSADYITFAIPNAKSLLHVKEDLLGRGIGELIGEFDGAFMHLVFLSSSVYRVKAMLPFLRHGYASIGSGVPHTVMAMCAFEQGSEWLASGDCIVDYVLPDVTDYWPRYPVFVQLEHLDLYLKEEKNREMLRRTFRLMRSVNPRGALAYAGLQAGGSKNDQILFYRRLQRIHSPRLREAPVRWLKWRLEMLFLYFSGAKRW